MQRERGQRLLQHPIVRGRVLIAVLPLMQIVIDIQRAEIRPREQRIAPAHKVSPHCESRRRVSAHFSFSRPSALTMARLSSSASIAPSF